MPYFNRNLGNKYIVRRSLDALNLETFSTSNQLTFHFPSVDMIINASQPSATRTYTIPDIGSNGNFLVGTSTTINLNLTGNLIPSANATYNIGSNSFQWENLYLAGVGYLATLNNGSNLTVPTSGSNLISDTASQTIKNKFLDTSNSIVDATDTTKRIQWALSSQITATNLTLSSAMTNNRTQTFQDTTDTFVYKNTVDNLQSKTLYSNCALSDATDNTKQIQWLLGSQTTGKTLTLSSAMTNNRTQTLQDVTDTFVYKTTNDTLTNKTLTTPVITSISTGSNTLNVPTIGSNFVADTSPQTLASKGLNIQHVIYVMLQIIARN